MFACRIFLGVSLIIFLRDFHVSSCGVKCTDEPVLSPTRLVVKHGDPTSAKCVICQHCQSEIFGFETPQGYQTTNGTTVTWTVGSMTEWDPSIFCYYTDDNTAQQCCSTLPVTIYQPPDNVSISFDHLMVEGRQHALQCAVHNVAPVANLTVTFYRGQTMLGQLQSDSTEKKPVTETFTLNITPSKEDDGGQYWCEAKLALGPEGPQLPPVVMSESYTATVHYKPQREETSQPDPIVIYEGECLQLNCTAVGNPSPLYTWTLPSHRPPTSDINVLTISSVTTADHGQYSCLVNNDIGNVTVVFHVDVKVNYILYIMVAVVVALVAFVIIGAVVYSYYYKNNRMGQYNLMGVFRRHCAVSTV